MKLSIIIPVYNGEQFIERSYASIMNQGLGSIDYELLFIDNNSKDRSVAIIRKLQLSNPKIKLFNQPRQGEAQARNMGIEMARGEYLYQLDVDDEAFPGVLIRMISVLDIHPAIDAVFGKMLKTDKTLATIENSLSETHDLTIYNKPYWGLKWFSDLGSVVGEGAFMHRRRVFETLGVYTEQLPIIGTDLAFDIKLGMTSNLAFIDTYIYLYFKHEVSLIQGVKKKLPRTFMVWPRLVKEHLPFYLEQQTPNAYKILLFLQIYQSLGRQLEHTKGFSKRRKLKKQLLSEIDKIKAPFSILFYLNILVLFPFEFVRKIYSYYLVPFEVKKMKN